MALKEIQRSRMQRGDKAGAAYVYRVEKVYTCPRQEAKTHEGRLWSSTSTDITLAGPLPAMTVQVVGADPNQVGNSLITVTYGRDLTYDPSTFQEGKATISLATRVTERPLTQGPGEKGLYLETGPDKDGFSWRIVGGANTTPHVDAMISVRTAYPPSSIDWSSRIIGRLGKVNQDRMGAMMDTAANTAMLIHGNVPSGFRFGDPTIPIPIEYVFWVKPNGWQARTMMQRFVHLPVRQPVLHEDTLEEGEIYYLSEAGNIPVTAEHLAVKRQIAGSYAFGDAIPVGANPNDAFDDSGRSRLSPEPNRGEAATIPDPIEYANFSDIDRLIASS
jgi:hypothetical protein